MKYNEIEKMVYEKNFSNGIGKNVILRDVLKDELGFSRCPSCQDQVFAEFYCIDDLEINHHYSSIKPADEFALIKVHECRNCSVCYVNPSLLEEMTK